MAEFEGYSGDFESANYSDVSGSMEVPTFQGIFYGVKMKINLKIKKQKYMIFKFQKLMMASTSLWEKQSCEI